LPFTHLLDHITSWRQCHSLTSRRYALLFNHSVRLPACCRYYHEANASSHGRPKLERRGVFVGWRTPREQEEPEKTTAAASTGSRGGRRGGARLSSGGQLVTAATGNLTHSVDERIRRKAVLLNGCSIGRSGPSLSSRKTTRLIATQEVTTIRSCETALQAVGARRRHRLGATGRSTAILVPSGATLPRVATMHSLRRVREEGKKS